MLCQLCDVGTPSHVCFNCVDNRSENVDYGGILICDECMTTVHNRGCFLSHKATPMGLLDKRLSMISELKDLKKSLSDLTTQEIQKLNVRTSLIKAKVDATQSTIHSKLMEVYNLITEHLSAKEKELYKTIEDKVKESVDKANSTRDALKDLSSKVNMECDAIIIRLSAKKHDGSDDKFDENVAQFEEMHNAFRSRSGCFENNCDSDSTQKASDSTSLVLTICQNSIDNKHLRLMSSTNKVHKLIEAGLNGIGPYTSVDCRDFEKDGKAYIDGFHLREITFYSSETLLDDQSILAELSKPLEENCSYTISSEFFHRNMVMLKQAVLSVPHPAIIRHGRWLLDILEYQLLQALERNQLTQVTDSDLLVRAERSTMLLVKLREGSPLMLRCAISLPASEERGRNRRRRVRVDREVYIHPLDYTDMPSMKLVLTSKVYFYEPDQLAKSISPLMVKAVVRQKKDMTSVVPDWIASARKRVFRALETGKEMKVTVMEQVQHPPDSYIPHWICDVRIDDVKLEALFAEAETEPERPKLCQDVRVLRGDRISIVRETIGSGDGMDTNSPKSIESSETEANAENGVECNGQVDPEPGDDVVTTENHVTALLPSHEYDDRKSAKPESSDVVKTEEDREAGMNGHFQPTSEGIEHVPTAINATTPGDQAIQEKNSHEGRTESPESARQEQKYEEHEIQSGGNISSTMMASPVLPDDFPAEAISFLIASPDPPLISEDELCEYEAVSSNLVVDSAKEFMLEPLAPSSDASLRANATCFKSCGTGLVPSSDPFQFGNPPTSGLLTPPECYSTSPSVVPLMVPSDFGANIPVATDMCQFIANTNLLHSTGPDWNDEERRSLKYLTLILFGENSREHLNSALMGEPPASVKKAWSDIMRKQRWLWSLVPASIFQQLLEHEMQRFPDLSDEFCRFGIPLNIFTLPARLGPQLATYVKHFPEFKVALDIVYREVNMLGMEQTAADCNGDNLTPFAAADSSTFVDQALPSRSESSTEKDDPCETYRGEFAKPSSAVLLPAGGRNPSSIQKSCRSLDGDHRVTGVENLSYLKRSTSESKLNRYDVGKIDPETASARSQQSEAGSDWIEEDEDFPMSSGLEPAPRRTNNNARKDERRCFNCNKIGHMSRQCPFASRTKKSYRRSDRTGLSSSGRPRRNFDK